MEKHCKNCIYRVFTKNDRFKTYGFCLNSNVSCAEYKITNFIYGLVSKTEIKIPKDSLPACLYVQTYYEGNCPYYESKSKGEEE